LPTHVSYNEKEVLPGVVKGDEEPFCELFMHWHQLLAGYVLRLTEKREPADPFLFYVSDLGAGRPVKWWIFVGISVQDNRISFCQL
jgi:hypothetical protein